MTTGRKTRFIVEQNLAPKGYQKLTDLSSAVGLTVPEGAYVAIVVPESQNVRYRDDGVDPTSTDGVPLTRARGLWCHLLTFSCLLDLSSARVGY